MKLTQTLYTKDKTRKMFSIFLKNTQPHNQIQLQVALWQGLKESFWICKIKRVTWEDAACEEVKKKVVYCVCLKSITLNDCLSPYFCFFFATTFPIYRGIRSEKRLYRTSNN